MASIIILTLNDRIATAHTQTVSGHYIIDEKKIRHTNKESL
jgi:hypothetical protein